MNVLSMHIPPHTFWGWAFEIGVALAVLWVLWIIILIACEPTGSTYSSNSAIAPRERQAAKNAASAIDDVYRRAEDEVRRLGQLASHCLYAATPTAQNRPSGPSVVKDCAKALC